jgi:hypothetical protein
MAAVRVYDYRSEATAPRESIEAERVADIAKFLAEISTDPTRQIR